MKNMNRYLLLTLSTFAAMTTGSYVQAADCALCEDVRAYNIAHPENNYEYYEDYLKAQNTSPSEKSKNTAKSEAPTSVPTAPKKDTAKPGTPAPAPVAPPKVVKQ